MEIRQLEYFVAVAEEQHFSRAATRLHVVQSAVSAAIKRLEGELEVSLFLRNAKSVTLTDAGTVLLPRARAALDAVQHAVDSVADVRGGLRGTLRLGTLTSVPVVDVPELLGEFHRRHPGVELRTGGSFTGSRELLEALLDRRLDLAFVSSPAPPPLGVRQSLLASSPVHLAVPTGHPLADTGKVTLSEIAGLEFIDMPVGYGNREITDRAFAATSLRRRVTIEITDIGTGVHLVRHGLGVALLPAFLIDEAQGVVAVAVTDVDMTWTLSLAVPADRSVSAPARALLDIAEARHGQLDAR